MKAKKKKKYIFQRFSTLISALTAKTKTKKKKHEIQQTKTIHYRNSLIKQNSNYESKKKTSFKKFQHLSAL